MQEGTGLFGPRAEDDLTEVEPTAHVLQGSLEGSNVTAIEEMVRMTSLLKHYEATHRMMLMQNDALGRVVNNLIPE